MEENNTKSLLKLALPFYIVFGLIIIVTLYLLTPASNIKEVSVSGNTEVDNEEILNASQVSQGDSIWETFFNRGTIEDRVIDENVQVSGANLNLSGLRTYDINVAEYNTVAYAYLNEEVVNVLENGGLIDGNQEIEDLPYLLNFEDDEKLQLLVEQLNELDDSVLVLIEEIELSNIERNPYLVRSYMSDGSQVLADLNNYAEKMMLYPQLSETVDNAVGLYDLEVGAYFTPFEASQTGGQSATEQESTSTESSETEESSSESLNEDEAVG